MLPGTPKGPAGKLYGCSNNKPYTVQTYLQCKVGGLVMDRHDEIRDSLALMVIQAFTSYSVHDKPLATSSQYGTGTGQTNNITTTSIP